MFKLVVLSVLVAVSAASPVGPWGVGLGGLGIAGWGGVGLAGLGPVGLGHLGAPLLASPVAVAATLPGVPNYRGPLSLAPGQPANILAADGRPLDTLSVNLDRAAHLTARAVDVAGLHILKKRSAPLLAPALAVSHASRIDLPARVIGPAPLALGAPLGLAGPVGIGHLGALRAPIGPLGLGLGHGAIAPWGLGGLGHGAPLGIW